MQNAFDFWINKYIYLSVLSHTEIGRAIFKYKIFVKMFISFPFHSMLILVISVLPYNFRDAFRWYVRCSRFPWYGFKKQYTAISSIFISCYNCHFSSNFHFAQLLWILLFPNLKCQLVSSPQWPYYLYLLLCFVHRKWKKRKRKSNKKRKIVRFLCIFFY